MQLRRIGSLALLIGGLVAATGSGLPGRGRSLSPQVLALYPPEAGEEVFVDLQTARRSPHFRELKTQLLPNRFRELEQFAARLGVDFERNVDRLSWVFINTGDPANSDLAGAAEGAFYLPQIEQAAAAHGVEVFAYRDARVFVIGKNDRGQQFVFAFRDNANCLFGFREHVGAMLERAAQGGASLLDNRTLRSLIDEVNRRASIWLVLDGAFTQLGVRQFLGEAANIPGMETLAGRVRSATVRIELTRGLDITLGARCATATDSLWFSAFIEGALFFQRQRFNESNPTLARILSEVRLQRTDERLSLSVSVPESDLVALLQAKSFSLTF